MPHKTTTLQHRPRAPEAPRPALAAWHCQKCGSKANLPDSPDWGRPHCGVCLAEKAAVVLMVPGEPVPQAPAPDEDELRDLLRDVHRRMLEWFGPNDPLSRRVASAVNKGRRK